MRTFSRVLLLAFGTLLGSAATSEAITYEVSWVDVRFEPTYDQFSSRALGGHPSGMVPVTINGSVVWDSDARQMVAGILPPTPLPDGSMFGLRFDPALWTITGMNTPGLYYGLWGESGLGSGSLYTLFGETGFGGVIQFLMLSAPSAYPDFTVGIYDASAVPQNSLCICDLGGSLPPGVFTPVSGEIRVAAVPELAIWAAMALGVVQLVGLWGLMNRQARTA